jgi:hypothetical protein
MLDVNNFPFFGQDESKEKFQVEMLKKQILQEQAESQKKIIELIAATLATSGVKFKVLQNYSIQFESEDKSLLTEELEKLVQMYGMPLTVFENK